MIIKGIRIVNFKSIVELNIDFNEKFNLIIGKNNIGKSTIFESIELWKKLYDLNITKIGNKFYSRPLNIRFSDLSFLRITEDKSLYNDPNKAIEITLIVKDGEFECLLGFKVNLVSNIRNAYFQIEYIDKNEFRKYEFYLYTNKINLNKAIQIFVTKPIANIIPFEAKQSKQTVLRKITEGLGFEVLRNKIISNKTSIQAFMEDVFEESIEFIERDKDNKEYITLMVKRDNIESELLSQGSGFLQAAEIFSSFEFLGSSMYLLLIDEPDSHLHFILQKKLIEVLKSIKNSQIITISHNEKFIDVSNEKEILFYSTQVKETKKLNCLSHGSKSLILNDLIGNISDVLKIQLANKVIIVEGNHDIERYKKIFQIYSNLTKLNIDDIYITQINGIDMLDVKIPLILNELIKFTNDDAEIILIRDNDFTPLNLIEEYKLRSLVNVKHKNKKSIHLAGFEFESLLFCELDMLEKILTIKYPDINISKSIIKTTIEQIRVDSKDYTSELFNDLNKAFIEQSGRRKYEHSFVDFMKSLDEDDISYLLNKSTIRKILYKITNKEISNKGISTLVEVYLKYASNEQKLLKEHYDLCEVVFRK